MARAAALVFTLLGTARPAHAYVDPGSGSFILQMLVAGMLSVAFTVRQYWAQLRAFARRLFPGGAPDDRDPTP